MKIKRGDCRNAVAPFSFYHRNIDSMPAVIFLHALILNENSHFAKGSFGLNIIFLSAFPTFPHTLKKFDII